MNKDEMREIIRREMAARRWSPEKLAVEMAVSHSTVTNLLSSTGKRTASVKQFASALEKLGYQIQILKRAS